MTDYYEVLGVPKTASADEIKKAFRKLAAKHHPDRGGDTEVYQKIQEAYDVLGNAEARAQYDQPPFTAEDILSSFFNFGQRAAVSPNARINVRLNLEKAYTGTEIEITDFVDKDKKLKVKIPKGVQNNSVLRIKGAGSQVNNLPRGDLLIYIVIDKHATFDVAGIDLHTVVNISSFEAMLGCKQQITTISGTKLNVDIPAGVDFNHTLLVKGHGMQTDVQKGNLYIRVAVKTPKLTDIQQTKLRELLNDKDCNFSQ